jgi:mRNA interferase MazF
VICEFGDIVVVPFPFVDLAAEKRRPSLILSQTEFNESHRHSICAMITTAARSNWPSDITIHDLGRAGLNHACVIRWKLFTLPNEIILKRLGNLAERDRQNVIASLHKYLA